MSNGKAKKITVLDRIKTEISRAPLTQIAVTMNPEKAFLTPLFEPAPSVQGTRTDHACKNPHLERVKAIARQEKQEPSTTFMSARSPVFFKSTGLRNKMACRQEETDRLVESSSTLPVKNIGTAAL